MTGLLWLTVALWGVSFCVTFGALVAMHRGDLRTTGWLIAAAAALWLAGLFPFLTAVTA